MGRLRGVTPAARARPTGGGAGGCAAYLWLKGICFDREVARASRSGFENNPDRDGLATVWTLRWLALIRRCFDATESGFSNPLLGVKSGQECPLSVGAPFFTPQSHQVKKIDVEFSKF
jgi:hypothetical protein